MTCTDRAPAARSRDYPSPAAQTHGLLSPLQQRLWFMESTRPGGSAHHLPTALRLRGPLQQAALDRALQALIEEQPALRMHIGGNLTPVLMTSARVDVSLLPAQDLREEAAEEREARLAQRLAELSRRTFDLAQGPLFYARLLCLAEQEHVLFLMAHRIIADAQSTRGMLDRLASLYTRYAASSIAAADCETVAGHDADAGQRELHETETEESHVRYWVEHLEGFTRPLEMPCDQQRQPLPTAAAAAVEVAIPADLSERIRAFAQRTGCTVPTLALAAYAVFLRRHTGQDRLVVGVPIRGHATIEAASTTDALANTLPIALMVTATTTFSELLDQVNDALRGASRHADMPLEQVIQELKLTRDEGRQALFQTAFTCQDHTCNAAGWWRLQCRHIALAAPEMAEDIALLVVDEPDVLAALLTWRTDLFTSARTMQFAQRYVQLIEHAIASPALAIGTLPVSLAHEDELLGRVNATSQDWAGTATLPALMQPVARKAAHTLAIVHGADSLDYAGLWSRVYRLCAALRQAGVGRGALVGLCLERSIDMVVAQLAILQAGGAYVPLDPAYPRERLAYMALNAKLAWLVTQKSLHGVLEWPRERSLWLDEDAGRIAACADAPLAPDEQRDARPQDPAYVIYTSGSTGNPKGVVVPHRAVVNLMHSMARKPGLAPGDRFIALTTLSFDMAVPEQLLPFCVGAQMVLASREQAQDPPALRSLVESSGANVLQATPSTWRMLLDAGWRGSPGFKALIGAESLPAYLADALLERTGELWNMYGPTETTVWSTCWRVEQPLQGISIGRPMANTQVHILDEAMCACPIGVAGEICIGGDGVTSGYLHRPELTAERFVEDPQRPGNRMYRTGDLGRWRSDGQLEHLGRLDFQLNVRGHRIEPGEIESALSTCADVQRALVLAREDKPGDVRLVAYIVPLGAMPPAATLREHLRASVPEYMVPQHFVELATVPLLPNGKVDRKSLPAPAEAEVAAHGSFTAPASEAELVMAQIWRELLGVEHISTSDNFFDLGGHSLLAVRAVSAYAENAGVSIDMRRLIYETLGQVVNPATAPAPPAASTRATRGLWTRLLTSLGR